jgi:L-iditol 2-dehydrogenase
VITGIPADVRISLEFHVMRRKELAFYNVRRSNHESEEALRLLSQHPGLFGPMITHRRPLEAIEQTFHMVECYEDGIGKAVVTFDVA